MIRSFRDADTEKLFHDEFSRKLQGIARVARRKLLALHAATKLEDLSALPGNHLELLKGDREGQHSMRINDQYRLCFVWSEPDASEVEIVDYH